MKSNSLLFGKLEPSSYSVVEIRWSVVVGETMFEARIWRDAPTYWLYQWQLSDHGFGRAAFESKSDAKRSLEASVLKVFESSKRVVDVLDPTLKVTATPTKRKR